MVKYVFVINMCYLKDFWKIILNQYIVVNKNSVFKLRENTGKSCQILPATDKFYCFKIQFVCTFSEMYTAHS